MIYVARRVGKTTTGSPQVKGVRSASVTWLLQSAHSATRVESVPVSPQLEGTSAGCASQGSICSQRQDAGIIYMFINI